MENEIDDEEVVGTTIDEVFNARTIKGKYKVDCWSNSNGDIKPRDVSKINRKNYIFLCDVCNHEFTESVYNIVKKNKWCPFCNSQKLCNNEDCSLCFEKSFASCKEE